MTNLADQTVYGDVLAAEQRSFVPIGKSKPSGRRAQVFTKAGKLSIEDQEIVAALNSVKHDLECLHNRYDNTTNELLVESIIYEMKAANVKYEFFLTLCKEKGIVSAVVC